MLSTYALTIIDHSPQPKYLQLADHFRRQIVSRQLSGQAHLPSINDLSARYNLSRDTVRKAYLELKRNNLVQGVRGKGYFVRAVPHRQREERWLLLTKGPGGETDDLVTQIKTATTASVPVNVDYHHGAAPDLERFLTPRAGDFSRIIVAGSFDAAAADVVKRFPAGKTLHISEDPVTGCNLPNGLVIDRGEMLYRALRQCNETSTGLQRLYLGFCGNVSVAKQLLPGFQRFCITAGKRGRLLSEFGVIEPTSGSLYVVSDPWELSILLDRTARTALSPGREVKVLYVGRHTGLEALAGGITSLHADLSESLRSCLSDRPPATSVLHIQDGILTRRNTL